jgi:hypothetical protein
LGPTEFLPEDGDRIQSPKRRVLKYKQEDVLDKNRTTDNVQKHNICTNVPSSQTFTFLDNTLLVFMFSYCNRFNKIVFAVEMQFVSSKTLVAQRRKMLAGEKPN